MADYPSSIPFILDNYNINYLSCTERTLESKTSNSYYHQELIDDCWEIHCEDGPAAYWSDFGMSEYRLYGDFLTKEEWLNRTTKLGKVLYG
jgi:hypothetical protein